jgi:hypothetical protein
MKLSKCLTFLFAVLCISSAFAFATGEKSITEKSDDLRLEKGKSECPRGHWSPKWDGRCMMSSCPYSG